MISGRLTIKRGNCDFGGPLWVLVTMPPRTKHTKCLCLCQVWICATSSILKKYQVWYHTRYISVLRRKWKGYVRKTPHFPCIISVICCIVLYSVSFRRRYTLSSSHGTDMALTRHWHGRAGQIVEYLARTCENLLLCSPVPWSLAGCCPSLLTALIPQPTWYLVPPHAPGMGLPRCASHQKQQWSAPRTWRVLVRVYSSTRLPEHGTAVVTLVY